MRIPGPQAVRSATKPRGRAGATAAALLAAAWIAGCSFRKEKPTCAPPPPSAVAVFQPVMPGLAAQASLDLLRELFPGAPAVTRDQLGAGLDRCAREGRVLVIPDAARFPMDAWGPLKGWLDAGHAAVFVGCDPLEARVRIVDGRPEPEPALFERLAREAAAAQGFSSILAWQHLNNSGDLRGAVRTAQGPDLPWPGITVEVKDLDLWDAMVIEGIPAGTIPATGNSLAFYAHGDPRTTRLVIECEEEDGARWTHPLALSEQWTPYVVHEAHFLHHFGGKGRGGPGDHLSLPRVRRVLAGLSVSTAPQAPGDHLFGLSDFRVASDPRTPAEAVEWPNLFLLSPPYRRYGLRASRVESIESGQSWDVAQTRMQGPLPRARGLGGEDAAPYRWIPLFRALDDGEDGLGWPASIYVEPAADGATRRWAWVGVDPSDATRQAAAAMISECVQRLHAGLFLFKAGSGRYTLAPDATIGVTTRGSWTSSNAPALRVVAELLAAENRAVARRVTALCPEPGAPLEITLGRAPEAKGEPQDFVLRLSLEDAAVRGKVWDRVEQPLKLLARPRVPADREWVTVTGSRFTHAGQRLFLLGVNYWPLSAVGRMPGEPSPYWLDPAGFDPLVVERDLKKLEDAGINAVSIQYFDEQQAPQLQCFIDMARRYDIRVVLFLGYLQPFERDLEKARRLFEAADLKNETGVFAIDLAWEPRFGLYGQRCRFDPAWREWLREQYGSFDHAEQVIGRPLWRRDGEVTGPSDEELAADGAHRAAVEVYRRFADDFVSRRYGQAVRALRRWGSRQLITARTGFGGTGNAWADPFFPVDPAAGAVHLDFLSPEGWGLHGNLDRFLEAGFITAYARGAGNGKPVAWLEFGASVGADPQAADLAQQASLYRNMLEMAVRSGAGGCFGWWYPGGWRVDENTDMGMVNPDGSWRPVREVFRDFAHRLRGGRGLTTPWRGREFRRGDNARGLSALWDRWRETYRRELAEGRLEEIRAAHFGRRTGEIPLRAAGGGAFADPAPLESVNAEWGRIEVDGAEVEREPGRKIVVPLKHRVRMELINTGAATWDASQEGRARTVWLGLEDPRGGRQQLPVGFARFGDRAVVSWSAPDPGLWHLRPLLSAVGGFGERLDMEIVESPRQKAP